MTYPTVFPPGGDPSVAGPLDRPVALSLLQRAQQLSEQGDYELAAKTYQRLIGNEDPQIHVAALLGLAEAYYRMDNEPAALQAWIVATQAPENPLTWMAWKALAAARVREGDITGAARAYREAERRAPPGERAEIASRLGWMNKEMGRSGTAERYFSRARAGGVPQPIVTYGILAVTIVIGILVLTAPPTRNFANTNIFYKWLALTKTGIEQGEYWRLVTVVLVHDSGSFLHLAFNMYALWIVGPIVERLYGPWRYLFMYMVAAAGGSTASFVFSLAPLSVGASGAIFGLFAVLMVANYVHKPVLTRSARSLTSQIAFLIAINLGLDLFIPQIDISAHIGGLIAGAWLGFLLVPNGALSLKSFWQQPAPGSPQAPAPFDATRFLRGLGVVALLAVIAAGVMVGPLVHFT
jgi:membrane associated rhomboid family serine protease